jgi:aspartyl-tRNA(Asn)/glutamyl-tRNA(Gln) amidotransferase subunit B
MSSYITVIGLEVHVQLKTDTKLFSACPADSGGEANTRVDVVTLGLPGVLPVVNGLAITMAAKLALATNSKVRPVSRFARKHYFYPDLPKGYQTSQFDEPFCEHGWIDVAREGAEPLRVNLRRIHLEEDAGKSIHDGGRGESLVDYNRAGVPLLEVVSEPDMRTPDEAVSYLKELHAIVTYLDVCDGNMEQGNFRCDANISLMPVGASEFGTRVEIKNMNSFRHLHRAIQFEQQRQAKLLDSGAAVVQETRLWNDPAGRTESMRSKEEAHDYRYMPCPDLLPLSIDSEWLAGIQSALPELPQAKRQRYAKALGLTEYDAAVLTATKALAGYFEATLALGGDPKRVANWITTELLGALGRDGLEIEQSPVSPAALNEIVKAVEAGTISGKMGKSVFERVYRERVDVASALSEAGGQITDLAAIEAVVASVVAANPDQVAAVRAGKSQILGFLVGQVMRQTKGKANPQLVNEALMRHIAPGEALP